LRWLDPYDVQNLVGEARAAARNDRDPNRSQTVDLILERAWNLCVDARSADPP
jgi:hypothetical protein